MCIDWFRGVLNTLQLAQPAEPFYPYTSYPSSYDDNFYLNIDREELSLEDELRRIRR